MALSAGQWEGAVDAGSVGASGGRDSLPHALSAGLPKDFLRPCLLLLREGEAHGYELAEKAVAQR